MIRREALESCIRRQKNEEDETNGMLKQNVFMEKTCKRTTIMRFLSFAIIQLCYCEMLIIIIIIIEISSTSVFLIRYIRIG